MKKDSPPNVREAVPAAKLYGLLVEAFEKVRNPSCRRCTMPLPIFRPPPDPYAANWHIGATRYCPFLCHLVMAEVQARLWTRYDLIPVDPLARDDA